MEDKLRRLTDEAIRPGFRLTTWSDGHHICTGPDPDMCIERVVGAGSRRKRWCIVDRGHHPYDNFTQIYAPKISGPFPTLEGAIAAYLILASPQGT